MELKWIHCNILDTQVKWRWEARPIRYGELRSVQKAKIAQGTSWPKHSMIRKVKIQRPPNNQHQIIGNGKSAGRRKTYFPSWRQKEINFVWAGLGSRRNGIAGPRRRGQGRQKIGEIQVGWGCESGPNCSKSCQRKRDRATAIWLLTLGTCWAEKEKLWRAPERSRLRNNCIKLGALEVLVFRIWTTASLSERNRTCLLHHMWPQTWAAMTVGKSFL